MNPLVRLMWLTANGTDDAYFASEVDRLLEHMTLTGELS